MKKGNKILQSVKIFSVLLITLFVLSAKGNIVSNSVIKQSVEKIKNDSNKEDKAEISDVLFDAAITVFSIEFSDFSEYLVQKIAFASPKKVHVEFNSELFTAEYFRILFSKILPINAP